MYTRIRMFPFVLVILIVHGCNTVIEPELVTPTIKQGIYGTVNFWEGDFMPTIPPSNSGGKITPVSRTVFIYELTSIDQADQISYTPFYRQIYSTFVGSVISNRKGFFQIELPAGEYSVFVEEKGLFYANGFDGFGNISPVVVKEDSLSKVIINITYKATF